ncbi:MAG: pyridoxamine 5'-phosphate oxidase family protein [Desulfomonile tiedjei]|nr:pyridoxamine 5'-phosphate oxidase family protein [Desulfomonile tiedjei]
MRRRDQEITDKEALEAILNQAEICRIGLSDRDMPYVIPVNFGYKDGAIYVHSSRQGRKMEIIQRNPNVCFEVEVDVETVPGEIPCKWTVKFKSVIGFGKASIVEDPDEKRHALNVIMEHYSGIFDNTYEPKPFDLAAVIKIQIESMTGKRSKK